MIEVPEVVAKSFRIDFKVLASWRVGSPIRVVSSTNWVWERGGFMLCTGRPLREEVLTVVVIDLMIPSAMRMNGKGERGSPCLIPLDGLKVGDGEPFSRIEKKEEEMSEDIH